MRIDNPSVSGSITFIGGNNTISADAVSLTGSLSGSFAGEFSGEAQTAISGAASIDTSSLATTGSNTFIGNQTHSGSILPAVNDTYDLGSTNYQWRDLFLSSGSLYIDGTQIISSDANTLTFTTDAGQSIKILETGGDDITFQTDTGNIEMKGTVEVQSGKKIIDSAGTVIQFGDTLGVTGSIEVSGTVDGIDLQIMSSSLSASIAGVSTDFDDLTNKPTLLSGSAQIATDISGSFISTSSSLASELLKNTTDTLTGDLTVTGTLTAQEFHTEFVSASILFDSGSTKFGDTQDDVHNFTGSLKTTGSVDVTSAVTSNTNFNLYSDGIGVIGKIGNTANDLNIFSTTGGHNGLRMHANGILPTDNSGTIIDNDADLGDPSYRFKDLYLGGSITSGAGATFAGMIMVNGDGIDIDNNDNLRLRFDNASVFKAGLQVATSTGDMITSSATDDFAIRSQSNILFATGGSTEKMRIDSSGNSTFAGTITAGDGTQAINADADLTLRNGNSFVGIDLKSARTSGNIGGLRYYGTASDSVPVAQFLVETDGQLKYYNGTNGAETRLTLDSSGLVNIPATADGNKFTITSSAGSNHNIIEMGQLGSDGFLDVSAAGGGVVSHLSGYTGYASYFLSQVGIGTTSPNAKLEVITTRTGTPSADTNIKVTDDSAQAADVGGSINFTGKYTDAGVVLSGSPFIRASKKNATTGDYGYGLKFGVRGSGSATNNVAMTIDSDSNVGINNTNPSAHSSNHNHLVVGSGVNDGNHGSANTGITIFTADSTFPYTDYARLVFTHSTLLGRGYTFEYKHRDNSSFADDEPSFKLIAGNDQYIAITTQDNNSTMPKIAIDPNYYNSSLTQGNLYRAMFTIPVRSGVNNPGMHIYGDSQGNSNPFLGFTSTSSSSSITTKFIRFYHNSTLCGTIQKKYNANEVQYLTTSDYRLKEDLKPFKALDTICKVNVYNFKWKDIEGDNVNYGVIAHELQELIPEVVTGEKDEVTKEGEAELQGVDYSKLVPHLIQSIQELKAEIETLKTQING